MSIRYGKPPITEAIFDLRVTARPNASAAEIASGFTGIESEYPHRQELPTDAGIKISFGPGGMPPQVSGGPVLGGFRYESADHGRIFQARRDGFVFSLVPVEGRLYDSWDAFCDQVRPLWEQYRAAWEPVKVVRAALRYVNHLSFSGPEVNLPDHFALFPGAPREDVLPSPELAAYSMQVVLPQGDIGATAVINTATVPSPPAPDGAITVVLDIDLYRERLAWDPADDATLWNAMGQLRVRKNELFRSCIKEATEKLLEPLETQEPTR